MRIAQRNIARAGKRTRDRQRNLSKFVRAQCITGYNHCTIMLLKLRGHCYYTYPQGGFPPKQDQHMTQICHHFLFWECQCGGELGQLPLAATVGVRNPDDV
jgi:hypothetical protein